MVESMVASNRLHTGFEPSMVAVITQLPRPARKARYDLKPLLVHVRPRYNYLVTRPVARGTRNGVTENAGMAL